MNDQTPATRERRPEDVILKLMAERYQMDTNSFNNIVIQMCIPEKATREHFAAFLLVAYQYELNPLTREIYAFVSKRTGQLQIIVGVDGWMSLINRNPEFDGMEFEDIFDSNNKLTAITCRMYRKDRARPTEVTEYMSECLRDTEQWKQWPARMLRHKTAIQCARYAFAISGIMDPDEAERMDVSGGAVIDHKPARSAPAAPAARAKTIDFREAPQNGPVGLQESGQASGASKGPERSGPPTARQEAQKQGIQDYTQGERLTVSELQQREALTIDRETGEVLDNDSTSLRDRLLNGLDKAVLAGEEAVRDWQNEKIALIRGLPDADRKEVKLALAKAWEVVIDHPEGR